MPTTMMLAMAICAFTVSLVSASSAYALTLTRSEGSATATADFFGTSFPPSAAQETFGPFGGVAVAEVTAFGQTRAAQTGSGLNAVTTRGRLGDIPNFSFRAQTDIDQQVRNEGTAGDNVVFDYLINGGELRLFDPIGSFNGLEATVAVSIFAISPGASGFLWDWGVTLHKVNGVLTASVHGFAPIFDFLDPLGLGQPAVSAITVEDGEAVVSIAPFTASIDLGELAPTGTALVSYTMFAALSGPGLNATGGEATLGDPFNLAGDPGSVISFRGLDGDTPAVPEPPVAPLAAFVLAALLAIGRKTRRFKA